jgi:glycosyltransferase involved in cell wall biosynthesis
MKRSLRIVHTVSSLGGGGMEHFVVRLVEAQRKAGHDASIFAVKGGPLFEQARAKDLPVHVLTQGTENIALRLAKTVAFMARLRPDVVHAHNPTSMQYAVIGKLVARARFVMTDHRGIYRKPTAFEWARTDAVVAVSEDTARISDAVGKAKRILVIANGVEIKHPKRARDEMRKELGLSDEPVCITVANLLPVKGHDVLLRALAKLKADGVRLTALFAGQGTERDALEKLTNELGLGFDSGSPTRVKILGFRADVTELLGASDFFVLPSRMEGLPLAVLEAMSHAMPVVATKVGGLPEVVFNGEHGYVVKSEDPDALAEPLKRLATDAELREKLGKSALERAKSVYSFDTMTARYDALYRELLGG